MTLRRQLEVAHSQGKVGACHFCCHDTAELWFDPSDDIKSFQVRCTLCGAAGPWADCGWEVAVPAWRMVERVPASRAMDQRGEGDE